MTSTPGGGLSRGIEEERAFRATVRDRLTEVLKALVADLDLSAFALLQVSWTQSCSPSLEKRGEGGLFSPPMVRTPRAPPSAAARCRPTRGRGGARP